MSIKEEKVIRSMDLSSSPLPILRSQDWGGGYTYVADDGVEVGGLNDGADHQVDLEISLASVAEGDLDVVGITADKIGGHYVW